jgi:hypothetical protein
MAESEQGWSVHGDIPNQHPANRKQESPVRRSTDEHIQTWEAHENALEQLESWTRGYYPFEVSKSAVATPRSETSSSNLHDTIHKIQQSRLNKFTGNWLLDPSMYGNRKQESPVRRSTDEHIQTWEANENALEQLESWTRGYYPFEVSKSALATPRSETSSPNLHDIIHKIQQIRLKKFMANWLLDPSMSNDGEFAHLYKKPLSND